MYMNIAHTVGEDYRSLCKDITNYNGYYSIVCTVQYVHVCISKGHVHTSYMYMYILLL